MGKHKREEIWRHYQTSENKAVICGFCNKKYKIPNVNKMERHLAKCFKCPEVIKLNILKPRQDSASTIVDLNKQRDEAQCESTNTTTETANTVQQFTPEYTDILHKSLSNAIYVSGAPLAMVEHPAWSQFFGLLQPLYQLPSRKAVSTKYLDQIHKEVYKNLSAEFETQNQLHLQCDGWSGIHNEGIINFLVSKPEPVFVKSLDTKDNRHTGEYISQEIMKIMSEHGEQKFVVLIGDNAKNVQRAFQLVKYVNPHITCLNCAAHTLNLLCHDILQIPVLKAFIDMAVDCVKTIRKSQVLSAILAKIIKEKTVGETLKLPCKTRWGSHHTCLKSLENTKIPLQHFAVDEASTSLRPDLKMTLLDDNFWKMNKQCMSILEPVKAAILKLESDEMNIHKVFITLRDMKSKLQFVLPEIHIVEDVDKNKIMTFVENRTKMCIKPIHLAAYLLDPLSQGCELSDTQEADAVEYIYNMAGGLGIDIMPDLAKYKAKEGIWGKEFVWSHVRQMNPVTWWKGVCGSTRISKIALRILTAPCTSAATERSFSVQSNIHTKKRNRLTTERAGKLTFVAYNWNLRNRKNESNDDSLTDDFYEDLEEASTSSSSNCTSSVSNSLSRFTEIEFVNLNDFDSSDSD